MKQAVQTSDAAPNIPYIKAKVSLPEVTVKAVLIGIILALIFTMSSLYVGLKFARTVAASIPAALLSLMIFKAFKKSNILENVIVQTIASASESVAAMAAFCVTAIVLSGYWTEFKYVDTMLILGLGGALGVFLSIPLRNIMIVKERIPYPEGIAVAEVLISGESKGNATWLLLKGSFISAFITLAQSGFKIGSDFVIYATQALGSVFGFSVALSPLSIGAGYIIGLGTSGLMLIGALVANFVVLPYLGTVYANDVGIDTIPLLIVLQKQYLRYIAVGVMLIGSLWSLVLIAPSIRRAIVLSFRSSTLVIQEKPARTEKDIPFSISIVGVVFIAICIGLFFYSLLEETSFSTWYKIAITAIASIAVVILGFTMSSVASQLVGILGTTSLPASGLCLTTIILVASIISPMLLTSEHSPISDLTIVGITLVFTSIVGAVMVLGGDNMQDLKTGYLAGSTPWKQQMVLVIGVVVSVIATPFVLQTMFEAYGIGDLMPRPDMDPTKVLSAPQGMLISSVTKGLFTGEMPWSMVISGVIIGVIVITLDCLISKCSDNRFRLPIMTFAAGFYLPMGISVTFFCGGVLRALMTGNNNTESKQTVENGVMVASGLIAGEAIMGASLSIPFALYKNENILAINLGLNEIQQDIIGITLFAISALLFFKISSVRKKVT